MQHGIRDMEYVTWNTYHGIRIMKYLSWNTYHGIRNIEYYHLMSLIHTKFQFILKAKRQQPQ